MNKKDKQIVEITVAIKALAKQVSRERTRVDRVVQVLLNNLPESNLRKRINFDGIDCCGNHRSWSSYWHGKTLRDFLNEIIDP